MAHDNNNDHGKHTHHHIVPNKMIFGVGGTLLVLTVVTVLVAGVDLGRLNFVVAMAVASLKACLVALIFMNLWYDKKENGMIFVSSFVFLAIFIVFTSMDLFFRGDVYVKGPLMAAETKSKLKDPWISTPSLVAHGKELFVTNCASCHGNEGKGDGPAAGALNPPPRNFTADAGWKNGRKPTMVFKTLKEGLPGSGMASFGTLPSDDRWALTHYVLSIGSTPGKDTPDDFKKAGVDPSGGGAEAEEKVIPIELAMARMAVAEARAHGMDEGHETVAAAESDSAAGGLGGRLYASRCVQCHGAQGEGGIKVRNMGVNPIAYVTTPAIGGAGAGSLDAFERIVMHGVPGDLMPGNGQLGSTELRALHEYVRGLRGK